MLFPTFGFILSFILAALVAEKWSKKKTVTPYIIAALVVLQSTI